MSKILVVILLCVVLSGVAADFQSTLDNVAAYDYGQDRQALVDFSDQLRAANQDAAQLADYEKAMLEVLQSDDASFAAKQFLCKELSLIGTAESVPVLAKMLKNEKYADMARYALQRIPDLSVDKVLIKALRKTKDSVLVGVINTIGDRTIEDAVKPLAKLVDNKDEQVQQAALAALGKIGTEASAKVLQKAVAETKGQSQIVALDAFLKNADLLAENGHTETARDIYAACAEYHTVSLTVAGAALIGQIQTADDPTPVIIDALKSEVPELQTIAAAQIPHCNPRLDLVQVAALTNSLSPEIQIQLISAFQVNGDAAARPAVLQAIKDENEDVRVAALLSLSDLGNADDIELLVDKAVRGSKEEIEAAIFSLSRINVPGFDKAIMAAISSATSRQKEELVNTVGRRKMTFAVPEMLEIANTDDNRRVKVAAIKTLGIIAEFKDIDELIDLLVNVQGSAERREAERTLAAIALTHPDKEKQGDAVLAAVPQTDDPVAKASLLQVAGRIGDADALPVLQEALKGEDVELRKAAIRALANWPTLEPFDVLFDLAANADDATEKILAQRGCYTLLLTENDLPRDKVVDMYAKVLNVTETAGEKRMALSGLGRVFDPAAIELVIRYLDDPDTKSEAEVALVDLSWRVRRNPTADHKAALKKIAVTSTDERLKKAAADILERMN